MVSVTKAVPGLNKKTGSFTSLPLQGEGFIHNKDVTAIGIGSISAYEWSGKLKHVTPDGKSGVARLRCDKGTVVAKGDDPDKKPREIGDISITVEGGLPKTITVDLYEE